MTEGVMSAATTRNAAAMRRGECSKSANMSDKVMS